MNFDFKKGHIELVETLYQKKKATRDDFNFPMLSFYAYSKYLKCNDIIKVSGVNDKNQHIFVFTTKGLKFAELLNQISILLEGREG